VGVACAGEMYVAAAFSVAILLVLLRFGPRQRSHHDEDDIDNDSDDEDDDNKENRNNSHRPIYGTPSVAFMDDSTGNVDPELQPLRQQLSRLASERSRTSASGTRASIRQRPALGTVL
jgi:hypothetical protein